MNKDKSGAALAVNFDNTKYHNLNWVFTSVKIKYLSLYEPNKPIIFYFIYVSKMVQQKKKEKIFKQNATANSGHGIIFH